MNFLWHIWVCVWVDKHCSAFLFMQLQNRNSRNKWIMSNFYVFVYLTTMLLYDIMTATKSNSWLLLWNNYWKSLFTFVGIMEVTLYLTHKTSTLISTIKLLRIESVMSPPNKHNSYFSKCIFDMQGKPSPPKKQNFMKKLQMERGGQLNFIYLIMYSEIRSDFWMRIS